MNKRERQRLERAVAAGTVPCALCRREHPRDAATISRGRCVNRAACLKRSRAPGAFPKFVTLGDLRPTWESRRSHKKLLEVQAAEYHRVMEDQREARRADLVVV